MIRNFLDFFVSLFWSLLKIAGWGLLLIVAYAVAITVMAVFFPEIGKAMPVFLQEIVRLVKK